MVHYSCFASWRLIGWYKKAPEGDRITVSHLGGAQDTTDILKTYISNQTVGSQPPSDPSGSADQPTSTDPANPPGSTGLPTSTNSQDAPTHLVLEATTGANQTIKFLITIDGFDGDAAATILDQHKGRFQHLLVDMQEKMFPKRDVIITRIYYKCIIIELRVKTIKALEELWERYKNGDIKKALERILITDEIRKLGKTIEMVVTMSEEQYLDARNILGKQTQHKEKDNPDLSLMKLHEEERVNFFQLTLLLFRDGNKKLRVFFKSQWPVVYQNKTGTPTPSLWTDIPNDATEMKNNETEPLKFQFNDQKVKFDSGDTNTWDFSLLTTVLNRSTLKFVSPSTPESNAIKELKEIRNELCHAPDAKIPTAVFNTEWPKACNALKTFGVTQDDIDQVKKDVKKPVDELLRFLKESLKGEKGILDAINKCAIINSVLEATTAGINIRSEITASGYDGDVAVRIVDKFRSGNQHLLADLQDAICPRNSSIHNIGLGSIIIELRVKTIKALEELWERYKNGDLKNALERVLITDEIRKLGKTIEMVVTMSKEQYLDAFSFLYELTRHQEKGNPVGEDESVKELEVADSPTPNQPVANQPEDRMAHQPPSGSTVGLPSDGANGQQVADPFPANQPVATSLQDQPPSGSNANMSTDGANGQQYPVLQNQPTENSMQYTPPIQSSDSTVGLSSHSVNVQQEKNKDKRKSKELSAQGDNEVKPIEGASSASAKKSNQEPDRSSSVQADIKANESASSGASASVSPCAVTGHCQDGTNKDSDVGWEKIYPSLPAPDQQVDATHVLNNQTGTNTSRDGISTVQTRVEPGHEGIINPLRQMVLEDRDSPSLQQEIPPPQANGIQSSAEPQQRNEEQEAVIDEHPQNELQDRVINEEERLEDGAESETEQLEQQVHAQEEAAALSEDPLVSALMENSKELIDKICLMLYPYNPIIKNWESFAFELGAPPSVRTQVKRLTQHSQTRELFDSMSSLAKTKNLTVQELIKVLKDLRRRDVVDLLHKKIPENERQDKVTEKVMSDEALMEELETLLDKESKVVKNWYHIGLRLGLPKETLQEIKDGNYKKGVGGLFAYIYTEHPKLTVERFKEIMVKIDRKDVLDQLSDVSEGLMKKEIPLDSDKMRYICYLLSKNSCGTVKDWKQLARELNIEYHKYQNFEKETPESPTKLLLEWALIETPTMTVSDLCKIFKNMKRYDVIEAIEESYGRSFIQS